MTAAPCPFSLSNQVACPQSGGVVSITTILTTTTMTMAVPETPVGGTITCHYAVEFARQTVLSSVLSLDSRGPAFARAASVHSTRPTQLSLSNSTCPTVLYRPPYYHLRPFLPRLQLPHRLRGTRPRARPRAQIGGFPRRQWQWRR